MQKITKLDEAQNPLSRRLFLVSPCPAFFERLRISQEHPASEVVGIVTPQLQYETWFEGWGRAWRTKAKHDFLIYFCELWSSPHAPAVVAPDFIQALQTDDLADEIFDRWWTIRERIDLLEIDDTWRPSRLI